MASKPKFVMLSAETEWSNGFLTFHPPDCTSSVVLFEKTLLEIITTTGVKPNMTTPRPVQKSLVLFPHTPRYFVGSRNLFMHACFCAL